MDSLTEKKWFVYINDRHEGPLTLQEIQQRMSAGQVTSQSYVWTDGMPDWKIMSEVAEFSPLVAPPESPTLFTPSVTELPDMMPAIEGAPLSGPVEPEVGPSLIVSSMTTDEKPAEIQAAGDFPTEEDPQEAPPLPASEEEKKHRFSLSSLIPSRIIKWGIVLILIGALGAANMKGYLDFSSEIPAIQKQFESVSAYCRPYLLKISDKAPVFAKWISPIPSLPDVSSEDFESLKAAAREKTGAGTSTGPHVALALSHTEPQFPIFYLASNMPDGTLFKLYILGKGETLLNQLSFKAETEVKLEKKLGKTPPLRGADGTPFPKGEYTIYVAQADGTGPEAKPSPTSSPSPSAPTAGAPAAPETSGQVIAPSGEISAQASGQAPTPAATQAAPSLLGQTPIGQTSPGQTSSSSTDLPKDAKIITQKLLFLGGAKDSIYLDRLKAYHAKIQKKASDELDEIKQFTATLESQLESSKTKFLLLRRGKTTPKQRKLWQSFNDEWNQLQAQLNQIFSRWTPDALQKEFFYGVLFTLTQQAAQEVDKVHSIHQSYFATSQDPKTFDIQLGTAISSAESALSLLKSKTEQARNLQPTLNGLPRREGL